MPRSLNYKLAKISAPIRQQRMLFDRETNDLPSEIIAKAILRQPFVPAGDPEGTGKRWAIFNAREFSEDIIEGDFAREGSVEWPHVEDQVLTEDILSANPFCHFYFDKTTQVAAFQSTRMNKSLPAMLAGFDECLTPYVDQFGRFVYSQPLEDRDSFMTALRRAHRVLSVTFEMIPPNGYTNQHVRSTLKYIAEATEARDITIKIDGGKGGSVSPEAGSVRELSEECAAGNGKAIAPIVDSQGNSRTVSTGRATIVKQLADASQASVRKLLKWAGVKVDQ
jgi:hypothetical protein